MLEARLAPWLSGAVEHIGSTAVPGLDAKPIVDMLGPVRDLHVARDAIPVLAELGYQRGEHRPDEALWFYKQTDKTYETRTHQLHLTCLDSRLWRERIVFRDALREDDGLREEYAGLKHALSKAPDLDAYTDGKRAFVAGVLTSRGVQLG